MKLEEASIIKVTAKKRPHTTLKLSLQRADTILNEETKFHLKSLDSSLSQEEPYSNESVTQRGPALRIKAIVPRVESRMAYLESCA